MLIAIAFLIAAPVSTAMGTAPRTMRIDYIHAGDASSERYALEAVVLEELWPGNPDQPIDDTNLGPYLFEVVDRKTNRVSFSRGFASIYGEWESTAEAHQRARAFSESIRFPEPNGPVQVVIKKRDAQGAFRESWSVLVDPADPAVDRTGPAGAGKVWSVMKNGEPRDKVDILLMGDGYAVSQMEKWHQDAKRLTEILFALSPFKERRTDFNVWAVDTPAEQSGVIRPGEGIYRRTPLRASYDAFGSERYVLAFDNRRVREAAAAAPYEFVQIVVNERKYGGGGIFGLYATAAADNQFTPYIFVHEFGHHFADLGDEYYTSDVAYQSSSERPEPAAPNVTADPSGGKWKDLIAPGTELPIPWAKDAFETAQLDIQARRRKIRAEKRTEEEMEALFREERERMTLLLKPQRGKLGTFEGALYQARGYYRSESDCIMFTRDEVGFCAVCRRAIERVIDLYTRRRAR